MPVKKPNLIAELELEERLRFETLIADLSSKFINLPGGEVDGEIMDAQRRICELLDVDLSFLWQWSDGEPGFFTLTHLYSLQAGPQTGERMNEDQYPWAKQEMLDGRIISISSLEGMPAEAALDRESLRQVGIQSNLTLPLSVGGGPPVGLLSLNTTRAERDWPETLVRSLQLVGQVFANALARKRSDQALRESEEINRATFEQAAVGIAHVGTDGRWLRVNDQLCAIVGYPREELLQLTFQDITHPEDLDADLDHMRRFLSGEIETHSMEKRYIRKDRSVVWINLTVSLVRKAAGEVRHFISVVEDITERKRAEELLRSSQALLETGADLAGLGCYEIDFATPSSFADDRIARICGAPVGRHTGLEVLEFWLDHLHPDDRPRVLKEREELHGGRIERLSIKYRYLHPTEGEKWIHHLARVSECDPAGCAVRTFGVVRDVTQQERAKMEARDARENLAHLARVNTLGALSGSLAHELNQPLGIILSNAQAAQELLRQTPPDLAEVQDILTDIVSADRRAGDVIGQLRTLLKRGETSMQPLDLNQVIEEVLHLIHADLIVRGITVIHELAPDLPPVLGDRVQLQQLAINLILNAADAMSSNAPGARRINLQTWLYKGRVRTSVRDEGGGLPADPECLFQPFHTTKPHGLGLGLAICRSIVTAHEGRIWAEPHAERGAVFCFELPAVEGTNTP